jgi:hypothetical protein
MRWFWLIGRGGKMLDLVYIFVAVLFFAACWIFARACDRL